MKYSSIIIPFIFGILFIIILRSFFISNYIIDGNSMEPTFFDGDRVLVNQFIDIAKAPEIDDIYFIKLNENEVIVKRIVATPNDYIKLSDNRLYINGERTHYKDSSLKTLLDNPAVSYRTVPADCYLVIGDNLKESTDSRTFGCINSKQMLGKVIYTYWHNK